MSDFAHLHCHTQYSLLDGASDITLMLQKAKDDGMTAAAITDHGNMFGVFEFYNKATQLNITPIIGCEFYMVKDRKSREKEERYHQLLLAKNAVGYKNLIKLCSVGFLEGFYYFPRIDKDLLRRHKDGLIATTCCVGAEIPSTILKGNLEEAEKIFVEWLEIFGDDYYVELQRHFITEVNQETVNQFLLKLAKKYNVKVICTNDSHYVNQNDAEAHDILLMLQTGSDVTTVDRFKFENNNFYFKSQSEMKDLFKDVPFAVENTLEIVSKIEPMQLKRDILLPNFKLPEVFVNENDYLRHLTLIGARVKYKELSSEITERIDYELKVVEKMGYAGYFLIVQDFIRAAKELGVAVGPGRGSAAGSVVAYCTGITNIDPIKYNLLFERFLNPERISMPDIDTDFDDVGRQKVIDYVVQKYGRNQVAQIITYGTMAARSAIRDVGRVLKLPLSETDRMAKLVPATPGITLKQAYHDVPELKDILTNNPNSPEAKTLRLAQTLEGSIRNRGVHAAGVIIAAEDITNFVPVCTAKDSELFVTQFDGELIEKAGMLKMDFLGLKTLSILTDALLNIKNNRSINVDIDNIPFDDLKTFELFQRGETIGIFQFESEGMRSYLKELRPTDFEDLIAMNALYRPGPMQFIPDYIRRKHGKDKVTFPHPLLEEILKPTNGIMVYQEQIMQTAQILAGYSLGQADLLRRAMGKKDVKVMEGERQKFCDGALSLHNIPKEKANEIFEIMISFAQYGFNRSHAAAYSVVAYQTAYLKANYPAEYLAAVLTHNMGDISQVDFFTSECKRMGIKALGPDINESGVKFSVNKKGEIRFALSAIKGVGESAVEELTNERSVNGFYLNFFDFVKRINLRSVNKKALESLAYAGAFDGFENMHRAQYFFAQSDGTNFIEYALRWANSYQSRISSNQNSLFGSVSEVSIPDPVVPSSDHWSVIEQLQHEKDVTGMYITGHPLDNFRLELKNMNTIDKIENSKNRSTVFGGIVTDAKHKLDKKGRRFGVFTLEDYTGSKEFALFNEDYLRFKHFLVPGELLYVKGTYQLRWKSADQYEFRISDIELLQEVRNKKTKRVQINMPLSNLTTGSILELENALKTHPGKFEVSLDVFDQIENAHLAMTSIKYKVDLNQEMIQFLQNFEHGECKLVMN